MPPFLRRPSRGLRAPARDRILEVADDRERERGQRTGSQSSASSSARAACRTRAATARAGEGSMPGRRAAPFVGRAAQRAIEHRARPGPEHDEPEDHPEDLPIGVDEPRSIARRATSALERSVVDDRRATPRARDARRDVVRRQRRDDGRRARG
jgi:hypothetical protein